MVIETAGFNILPFTTCLVLFANSTPSSSQLRIENVIDAEETNKAIFIQVNRIKGEGDSSLKRKLEKNADPNSNLFERWSKAAKSRTWLCLGRLLLKLYSSVLTNANDKVNVIISYFRLYNLLLFSNRKDFRISF